MVAALKTLDDAIKPLALRNHSRVLKAIAIVTQKHVADQLGIAPPTLSDWTGDHLERACQVLAAAGLQVAGRGENLIPPEDMRYFYRQQIRHAERGLEELGDTRPAEL